MQKTLVHIDIRAMATLFLNMFALLYFAKFRPSQVLRESQVFFEISGESSIRASQVVSKILSSYHKITTGFKCVVVVGLAVEG